MSVSDDVPHEKNESSPDGAVPPPIVPSDLVVSQIGTRNIDGKHRRCVTGTLTLSELADDLLGLRLEKVTDQLRQILALAGGDRDNKQFKAFKRRMESVCLALGAPSGTLIEGISAEHHNGLYSYDVDEGRGTWDIKEVRAMLITVPGMAIIAISGSGDALWCAVLGPVASSPQDFKVQHEHIRQTFPAGAQAAVANGSNNLNRERFLARDSECWLAENIERVQRYDAPPPDAAPGTPPGNDHDIDIDALQFIDPPDDYNQWIAMLGILYCLGFTIGEADAWCQRGSKYELGELPEGKWESLEGLAKETPEKARNKLRGMAYKRGWRRSDRSRCGSSSGAGGGSQGASAENGTKRGFTEKPSPIMASLPDQAPVQVPRILVPLVNALAELAACTPRAALAALLGAISALASGEVDVEWPNKGDVTPLTLFLLHLAGSGSRKSSGWGRAFKGHRRADQRVIGLWEEAKAEYQEAIAASKGENPPGSASDLLVPLGSSPVVLRRDATIEVLVRRLAKGRGEQCWEHSEAGSILGGWSFSRDNQGKALSDLQDIWSDGIVQLDRVKDDVELNLSGARLTIAWSCQIDVGRSLILGEAAGNGFAARCLLSADDHLPEYRPQPGQWPEGWSAQRVMEAFSDWVVAVREDQDYVHKGEDVRPTRTTYRLSEEAWEAVDLAGARAHAGASGEDLTRQEQSFLARVGENATRVAAVLAYYRNTRCDGDAIIIAVDAHDAVAFVRSCYHELCRQGVWAAVTADAEAAKWATKRLGSLDDRYKGAREGTWRINHWLACAGAGPAKHLRGDPEARARIIDLLESHGWINPVGRGVWSINHVPEDDPV